MAKTLAPIRLEQEQQDAINLLAQALGTTYADVTRRLLEAPLHEAIRRLADGKEPLRTQLVLSRTTLLRQLERAKRRIKAG